MAIGSLPGLMGEGGLSANDSTAKNTPGALAQDNQGNIYRYVRIDPDSACATTEGSCLTFDVASAASWELTPDVSADIGGRVVGVAQSAISTGNYGWVLVSGVGEVRTDGSVSAADFLVLHSADHEADTMADGEEEQVFGFALEADTGTEPHKALSYVYCI